jgi:DHA2 family multidrug resistance protein-like MFS transporter
MSSRVSNDWPKGLPAPRRYWAIAAIWLSITMAIIDTTIVNIALPTIATQLRTTPVASIWIVNAYQIAVTIVLLPLAALSERFGSGRIYLLGLLTFVSASLVCATAPNLSTLVVGRFFQGMGAGAIQAMNGSLLRYTFPHGRLGRGIGYNALIVAMASAAGPSIAAVVLSIASWQWLFAINVPIGLLALAIGYRSLPITPTTDRHVDALSILLNIAFFAALFLIGNDFAQKSVTAATAIAAIVFVTSGITLVRIARRQTTPLVPVDLFAIPLLRLSYLVSVCSWAAQTAALVSLPFFLQARLNLNFVEIGLLITPWPLAVGISAPIAGRLVETISASVLSGMGLAILAAGLLALAVMSPDSSHLAVGLRMAVCGIGFGMFQTPNNRTLLGVAPPARTGAAAGMLAVSRLVGQTSGGVLVALLFRLNGASTMTVLITATCLSLAGAAASLSRLTLTSSGSDLGASDHSKVK